jgi:hypothetical protein
MFDDTEVAGAPPTNSANAQSTQSADPAADGAACSGPEQAPARSEILRQILAHTVPAPLPAAWSFLPARDAVRSLCGDPPELIESLCSSFSVAELQAARVLVPGPDHEPQLVPVLRDPVVQVLVGASGEPIDLASDSGALFGADPPCFAYACPQLAAGGRPKRVFVVSLADLQVLRCLGFRGALVAGLAALDGQRVRRLFANLSPTSRPCYRLTLVGASLANLESELPACLAPILQRLHDAQVLFEYGDEDNPFEFWRPSAEDFDRIRAAVTFADRQIIRHAIFASVEDSVLSSSDAWRKLHEPDRADLESAHAALRHVLAAPNPYFFGNDVNAAAANLRAAIEQATTRRFLQAAGAASDPLESAVFLMKAEVIQHLNQNYGPLRAAKASHGFSFRNDPTLTNERLEDLERSIKLLEKLERLSPRKK